MGQTKTAVIDGGPSKKPEKAESSVEEKVSSKKISNSKGKAYKEAKAKIDKTKLYSISDAINLVKEASYSKFDGSVELHLQVRKAGLTAKVEMPHAAGKTKRIAIADDKTLAEIEGGKINFDVLLATADMMPRLVKFAKVLGPRGLMPNPKTGTLLKDIKDADKFSQNTINIKTEKKAPLIHLVVGKVSQPESEIAENIAAIISAITKQQILKAHLSASMSPSVKIDVA